MNKKLFYSLYEQGPDAFWQYIQPAQYDLMDKLQLQAILIKNNIYWTYSFDGPWYKRKRPIIIHVLFKDGKGENHTLMLSGTDTTQLLRDALFVLGIQPHSKWIPPGSS